MLDKSCPIWAGPRGVASLFEPTLVQTCLLPRFQLRRRVFNSQLGASRWARLHHLKEAPKFSPSNVGRPGTWRLRVYEDPLQDALYNTWGEAEDDWGLEEFTDEQLIDVLYEVGCSCILSLHIPIFESCGN